jgi:predicted Holliday junction resolvase-like endonuclease
MSMFYIIELRQIYTISKDHLIKQFTSSSLYAECPRCHGEFMLRDTTLFDGLGPFPQQALEVQAQLQAEIEKRAKQLEKKSAMADAGAEQRAIASGLGKILEKVVPAHRDFKIPLYDCRPLYEPIDLIAFNGLGRGEVTSFDFIEIKTGKVRLNDHEKAVKEAVEANKVGYKVIK